MTCNHVTIPPFIYLLSSSRKRKCYTTKYLMFRDNKQFNESNMSMTIKKSFLLISVATGIHFYGSYTSHMVIHGVFVVYCTVYSGKRYQDNSPHFQLTPYFLKTSHPMANLTPCEISRLIVVHVWYDCYQ